MDTPDMAGAAPTFDYATAFSRNLGWLTTAEQAMLRSKRVAIAGLGGVGGLHLLTLTRLGIGAFNLAEFDHFDLPNFNRQVGATMSSLGHFKLDVLVAAARDINPELDIRRFPGGVTADNLDEFLNGVDLFVDGLDFFAFDARRLTFPACAARRIPATTVAPLGMGAALLNFLPGEMTFEEYFRLDGVPESEQAIRLLVGLSPALLQRGYLMDPAYVDLAAKRGPSTAMACHLCAAIAATETLKILLKRGKVLSAPWGVHFDAYRNKLVRTWRPGGNRHPVQRLAIAMAKRQLSKPRPAGSLENPSLGPAETQNAPIRTVEAILDLARWAPSGDNTQPWRFAIISDDHVVVRGFDTRDHCVYDLDGHPSQLAIGGMLETMRIAATGYGLRTTVVRRTDAVETRPTFDVRLVRDDAVRPSPLIPYIRTRTVQRRPMWTRPLTAREKGSLEAAVGENFRVLWLDGWANRWRMACLMWINGKLRLTLPEAYEVHRSIVEWDAQFSTDKVPDRAIGLDPLATRLMQFVMKSWGRVSFFNTWLGGTLVPRLELDAVPAIRCGAHFAICSSFAPKRIDDYIAAGGAMQQFWLTATALQLHVQPEMTPLIFARYLREARRFSEAETTDQYTATISKRLAQLVAPLAPDSAVFLGRIGEGPPVKARSLRRSLSQLVLDPNLADTAWDSGLPSEPASNP